MNLNLYNTLTKNTETVKPMDGETLRIYSCGPTVYNHAHIGNLSSFIVADLVSRLANQKFDVKHAMNFTDVDDKTIKSSREQYPDMQPKDALKKLTEYYTDIFLDDLNKIGVRTNKIDFIKATDPESIMSMQDLVRTLVDKNIAYIAEDGIYFSIKNHIQTGKKYGQLVEITAPESSESRIDNDEYDKDSVNDFALWKFQKDNEPAWDFIIGDKNYQGRPGWHIECSAMSKLKLGDTFDIHTGGIDLKFPHHENEIAQSTAYTEKDTYAKTFVHSEHILVDGKKMSKSLNNFYTLEDVEKQGFNPLAFRMLVLQSHYQKPTNFSFELLRSAQSRLNRWKNVANIRHQIHKTIDEQSLNTPSFANAKILEDMLSKNLDTPNALAFIDNVFTEIENINYSNINEDSLLEFLKAIDDMLGLKLIESTPDIDDEVKMLIQKRKLAKDNKDWEKSDKIRDFLRDKLGIVLKDTASNTYWSKIY